jgi:hypothetical protein
VTIVVANHSVRVGDRLELTRTTRLDGPQIYGRDYLNGTVFEVIRVYGQSVHTRPIGLRNNQIVILRDHHTERLRVLAAGEQAKKSRAYGTMPEGVEGLIDPRDPGLQWFWDDVSAYAEESSYCSVFDTVLKELGLPPRKTMHTATINHKGLDLTARIMARTQEEANELLKKQLEEPSEQSE